MGNYGSIPSRPTIRFHFDFEHNRLEIFPIQMKNTGKD